MLPFPLGNGDFLFADLASEREMLLVVKGERDALPREPKMDSPLEQSRVARERDTKWRKEAAGELSF